MIETTGKNLIFVISQPRSGSTMLQKIIANHPDVHTTSEPWLMLPLVRMTQEQGIQADYQANWGWDAIVNGFLKEVGGQKTWRNAFKQQAISLYNQVLSDEKKMFLDKTPRYYYIIEELLDWFPQAKFILLMRNPLAVFSSILDTWFKTNNWLDLALHRDDLYLALEKMMRFMDDERVFTMHYEAVSAQNLSNLFVYLGLSFDESYLTYDQSNWAYGDPKINQRQSIALVKDDEWLTRLHHVQNWRLVSDYCRTIPSLYWQKSGYQQDALIAQLDAIRPQLVHFRTLSLQWLLSKKKQERTVLDYQYVRFLRYLS